MALIDVVRLQQDVTLFSNVERCSPAKANINATPTTETSLLTS
jgi:hypothetical protein